MPLELSYPSRHGDVWAPHVKHCLIYFITGNPGCVDYYEPFLSMLRTLLDEVEQRTSRGTDRDVRFHLLGRNLLGFDDGDNGGGAYGPAPFGLDMQIRATMDAVASARVDCADDAGARHGTPYDEVLLIGHSVGSYIALETFRRHQDAQAAAADEDAKGDHHSHSHSHPHLRLRTGILLFPTLTHLAQSPRGRKLARIMSLPLLGWHVPRAVQAFLWWLWPAWVLSWVVHSVLGFPLHAAAVTTRFLRSRGGVRQALHLARDELAQIGEDRWEEELWEVAEAAEEAQAAEESEGSDESNDDDPGKRPLPPKFIILFGENDHWVANEFRDHFVRQREEHAARKGPLHKKGRTQIVIDEKGLPHDFCIRHGEEVAEMVSTWISDIAMDI